MPTRKFSVRNQARPLPSPWIRPGIDPFDECPGNIQIRIGLPYDERSCAYGCQITEYIYWDITSILGTQNCPGRLDNISQEWRLNTAAKVQTVDPTLYQLLTDPKYAFLTKLPDGEYNPQS